MTKNLMKELTALTKLDKIEWERTPQTRGEIRYRFDHHGWVELRKSLASIPVYSLIYNSVSRYEGFFAGRKMWNAVERSINSMLAKEVIEKSKTTSGTNFYDSVKAWSEEE